MTKNEVEDHMIVAEGLGIAKNHLTAKKSAGRSHDASRDFGPGQNVRNALWLPGFWHASRNFRGREKLGRQDGSIGKTIWQEILTIRFLRRSTPEYPPNRFRL